jgi:inhibitor of KinA sporulation pathway (predicted exonuclease)
MYLMTSPWANAFGNYYLPVVYIAHATGLNLEGASEALRRACETGFCSYDEPAEVVWVHEMAKFQIAEELKAGDKRVKWVNDEYRRLPKSVFLCDIHLKYKNVFHLERPRGIEAPSKGLPRGFEGASKAHRSQEQEQEQEQDKRITADPKADSPRGQPPAPSVVSFKNVRSNHFRQRLEHVLTDIRQACESILTLPEKEKPFNPYQAVQKAVNEGKHPDAVLEVLQRMVDEWDSGRIRIPWAWWSAVLRKNSQNAWEKESQAEAENFKKAIADLAGQADLFTSIGLTVKTIPAQNSGLG